MLIFSGLESNNYQKAGLLTPLRNTTGECLRLFASTTKDSYLHVSIQSENLQSQRLQRFQSRTADLWGVLFIQLPIGLNRVVLEGNRKIGRILLDDVEISACQKFHGKYHNLEHVLKT